MGALTQDQVIQAVRTEWPAALSDAGLEESDAALWQTDETPEELRDVAAMYFLPHRRPDPPYGLSQKQVKEAMSAELSGRHRVELHLDYTQPDGVDADAARALFGALLRHELEHARQQAACGTELFDLYTLLRDDVMGHAFGGGIPGSYLNCVPMEMDANAAAGRYLRRRHPEHVDAISKSECRNLTRFDRGPQPHTTLRARMVSFAFLYREAFEELAGELPAGAHIAVRDERAAQIWEGLIASTASSQSQPDVGKEARS